MPKPIREYGKNLVNDLAIKYLDSKEVFLMERCFKINQKLVRGTSNLLDERI